MRTTASTGGRFGLRRPGGASDQIRRRVVPLAVIAISVAFAATLGHPSFASHPGQAGFNLDISPESISGAPGATVSVLATLSPAAPAVGVGVDFENTNDGADDPLAPDATCAVAASTTQCSALVTLGGAPGGDVYGWVDIDGLDTTCEADRAGCGSPGTEGPVEATTPGGHTEPDNTDVASIGSPPVGGFTLDCDPDVQMVPVGNPVAGTCTQRNEFGVAASGFAVDVEILGGTADGDGGNFDPTDGTTGAPAAATFPFGGASTVAGVTLTCLWIDTDGDTTSAGSIPADGSDCAAEAANPAADDADTTEVICLIVGESGQCPTGAGTSPGPGTSPSPGPANAQPALTCPSRFNAAALGAPTNQSVSITASDTAGQTVTLSNTGPGTLAPTSGNPVNAKITYLPTFLDWLGDLIPGFGAANIVVTATDNGTPPLNRKCTIDVDVVLFPGSPFSG